jgi:hypothetical protein
VAVVHRHTRRDFTTLKDGHDPACGNDNMAAVDHCAAVENPGTRDDKSRLGRLGILRESDRRG